MLLRIRITSFLAGFGLAGGAALWQLRQDVQKSHEFLAEQARSPPPPAPLRARPPPLLAAPRCPPLFACRGSDGRGAPIVDAAWSPPPAAGGAAGGRGRDGLARRRATATSRVCAEGSHHPPPFLSTHHHHHPPQAREYRNTLEGRLELLEGRVAAAGAAGGAPAGAEQ